LVGELDADHVLQLAGHRPFVDPIRIALDQYVEGTIDEDLREATDLAQGLLAHLADRADVRHEDDRTLARQELRDPAEQPGDAVANLERRLDVHQKEGFDIRGRQEVDGTTETTKPLGEMAGERLLPRPAHASEPEGVTRVFHRSS